MLNKTELTRQLGSVIFRLHQNKLNAEQGTRNFEYRSILLRYFLVFTRQFHDHLPLFWFHRTHAQSPKPYQVEVGKTLIGF